MITFLLFKNIAYQLHAGIPDSIFHVIETEHGHDGFLLEQDIVGQHINDFLKKKTIPSWFNLISFLFKTYL